MDPLSVTSAVVGIVGFFFQLAKTASKVKTAVEEVKSAPKEARKLVERLTKLQTLGLLIGGHLERRASMPNCSSSPSLDILSTSLAQCLAKTQELEQILSKLLIPQSKFSTSSRLRLVLRKEKLNSLVQEINSAISDLELFILVDMCNMNELEPQETPVMALEDSAPHQYHMAQEIRRTPRKRNRTFRYLGGITWVTSDTWNGGDESDGDNHIAHREGRITFRLPYTSKELTIYYAHGMGTPSYALNVVHIIELNSKLGLRLWQLMTHGSDVDKLHKLISKRKLSLYSILRHSDRDLNLFFLAVSAKWANGCRYLLQHDFRHEFEQGTPCMLETDVLYLLDNGTEPEYFTRYLNVFMKSLGNNHVKFLRCAWKRLVENMFNYGVVSDWIPAARYLIDQAEQITLVKLTTDRILG
ncbi:hypothetical protein KVR01_008614 [Diaporthe batatas]|uniref:uncharacterized protein n=1 Tax=Diaporthe batatas TaxID=748121 RepID=UPI001D03EB02|nr:uncharacterized protein KVR01_008614 [Diaporthe batatas]KAG8161627.1 hypothetical protein KVR01_008614 [Diaporthe batatas]